MSIILEKPDHDLVDKYIGIFKEKHQAEEDALKSVFNAFPSNQKKNDILVKVVLLNSIYHTRIKELDRDKVVNHIKKMGKRVDDHISSNDGIDFALLKDLSSPEGMSKIISFTSKYLSFCLPKTYPIMDSYTKGMLYFLNEKYNYAGCHFSKSTLDDYRKYVGIYKGFCQNFQLDKYSFKEIDMYLWAYAKYRNKDCVISIYNKTID